MIWWFCVFCCCCCCYPMRLNPHVHKYNNLVQILCAAFRIFEGNGCVTSRGSRDVTYYAGFENRRRAQRAPRTKREAACRNTAQSADDARMVGFREFHMEGIMLCSVSELKSCPTWRGNGTLWAKIPKRQSKIFISNFFFLIVPDRPYLEIGIRRIQYIIYRNLVRPHRSCPSILSCPSTSEVHN